MLWLAGLVGAFVVGTVAFLDLGPSDDDEDESAARDAHESLTEHGFSDLFAERPLMNFDPMDLSTFAQAPELETPELEAPELDAGMGDAVDLGVGSPPEFASLDMTREDLIFVWDDSAGSEPDLSLAPSEEDAERLELRMGGEVMARIPAASGLGLAHVSLLPMSAARELGWLPESDA